MGKKKQINICVDFLRKTKIEYSKNLNIKICLITPSSGKQFNLALVIYVQIQGKRKKVLKEKGNLVSDQKEPNHYEKLLY